MTDREPDPQTVTLKHDKRNLHVHLRSVYGDEGENEGVLSVCAHLNEGPNYPERGLIILGSPSASPLIEGYIPDLGGFSCGIVGAELLIGAPQNAVDLLNKERS